MSKTISIKLKLSKDDKNLVKKIQSSGREEARVIKRARILELFDSGKGSAIVAEYAGVTPETARRIAHNYNQGGINNALYDKPRPGNKRALDNNQANQIIAMTCSDSPKGYSRWTIELIVEEAIKRKIVSSIGRETIRILLHTHDIKPWREKNVVCPDINRRIHRKNGGYIGLV
jgi:transposase